MKKMICVAASYFVIAWTMLPGIYDFTVSRIEGGSQSLAALEGKKILIITLPLQQSASADSLLYSIDSLASANSTQLAVIAVPSIEDGYSPSEKSQLQEWYRGKLGNHVIITEGLYTHKISGFSQHSLFQWLTKTSGNGTFNLDCEGPGMKFFADSNGKLFSVFGPQTRINGKAVRMALGIE